jgi:hypothetical protein
MGGARIGELPGAVVGAPEKKPVGRDALRQALFFAGSRQRLLQALNWPKIHSPSPCVRLLMERAHVQSDRQASGGSSPEFRGG